MSATSVPAPATRSDARLLVLAAVALLGPWLLAALLPTLPQPQSFHDFADQRPLWGVPHALNVLSNLPFLLIGVLGLRICLRPDFAVATAGARYAYVTLFAGVALTAFGSTWYHLAPNDASLFWDRLPMALGFAGLVAGTLADRLPRTGGAWLPAFAAVGTASVGFWAVTGDLTPYVAVQAGFIALALAAALLRRSPYTHQRLLYVAAALYGLAILAERQDHALHHVLGAALSGHTLKHLLAAAAVAVLAAMAHARRPAVSP
jgi:hypothetical protein